MVRNRLNIYHPCIYFGQVCFFCVSTHIKKHIMDETNRRQAMPDLEIVIQC